ncbi:MAG: 1,5-anhydro-D-fructose reductase [Firmicutes bacterium]|nr:1,5-anhydro-D-fructose reductase [Bacillota bacterium]
MKKLKAGIIGIGFVGVAHIEAIRRTGFAEIAGIAGRDYDKTTRQSERLGITRVYRSWQEMVSDPHIDIIHNCTPNHLHFQINKAAIQAGKPIFSEKPLAMDSRESENLVGLAKEKGVANTVNYNYRGFPLVQQARYLVQSGYLGDIRLVHGSYLQDWLMYPEDYNWRLETPLGGKSRAFADIGTHWCDLVQYITGLKISEVLADIKTIIPERSRPKTSVETFSKSPDSTNQLEKCRVETEDYCALLLSLENGVRGSCVISQVSPGRKNRLYLEIDGSKRSVVWDQENPNYLWIGSRDGANLELMKDPSLLCEEAKRYADYPGGHNEGWPDGPKNIVRNFYGFVRDGKDPLQSVPDFPTFEDGHLEMKIIDAVLDSSQRGRWVRVK